MIKTFAYTAFALVAFAFNSILCRLALRGDEADAAGFTAVRLVSGAVTLVALSYLIRIGGGSDTAVGTIPTGRGPAFVFGGSWVSALLLFAYAACFSFAYLGLTAGTGALILFGAVQMTMIAAAIAQGEQPTIVEWAGLLIALGGLVYLVFPGLASPPVVSSALMAAAGISWGFYTLRGRSGGDPLTNTTGNFVRSLPFVIVLAAIWLASVHATSTGILLAVLSGAVASGIGYTVWYAAIRHHTSTRAAVLQLSVPVIAAVFGVVLMGETMAMRLGVAAALILGGIALTIFGKGR